MAVVDSTVTPTTASRVKRSFSLVWGSTEEIAMAAEAPQMPTEPPDKMPSSIGRPSQRASSNPVPIVRATASTSTMPTLMPRCDTWPSVMRIPSSATPIRSTVLAQKVMPLRVLSCSDKKCIDSPISSE